MIRNSVRHYSRKNCRFTTLILNSKVLHIKRLFIVFTSRIHFTQAFFAVKLFKNQFQKAAKKSCCIMFFVKINHPKFIFEPKLYMQNCDKLCTTAKLKRLFVQTT